MAEAVGAVVSTVMEITVGEEVFHARSVLVTEIFCVPSGSPVDGVKL
jgi:hypothetical protein